MSQVASTPNLKELQILSIIVNSFAAYPIVTGIASFAAWVTGFLMLLLTF